MLIGEKRSCKEHMVSCHVLVLCKLILCRKNYHNIFFFTFFGSVFFLVLNLLVFLSFCLHSLRESGNNSHSVTLITLYTLKVTCSSLLSNSNYFLITESLSSYIFSLCSTTCWSLYQEIS